ncbi:hypothetical protein, partial [Agrilactobacillus composti]|uniref:hypothetical protein n=1 Tax=Agrilactobacillus composti TaxID=398555 RepID=UPI001F1D5D64
MSYAALSMYTAAPFGCGGNGFSMVLFNRLKENNRRNHMYNLRHNTLKSNTDITIDNAGSEVSSNTGLLLFSEHLYQRGFTD